MLSRGEQLTGGALLAGAAGWFVLRSKRGAGPTGPVLPAMKVDEAYRVLNLAPGVDEGAVRLAHRRLVQKVHPDQGGSADLAARVNAARDALLAELDRPGRR